MNPTSTRIVHRGDLHPCGFAGIVETRLLMNRWLRKEALTRADVSHGPDRFVDPASVHFNANDGASMHPNKDTDIASFIPNGAAGHAGSTGHGPADNRAEVQVQRAVTGIQRAKIRPSSQKAGIKQIWYLPPEKDPAPEHQDLTLREGTMTCQIGLCEPGATVSARDRVIGLIRNSETIAHGNPVSTGDILAGNSPERLADAECGLDLIQHTSTLK